MKMRQHKIWKCADEEPVYMDVYRKSRRIPLLYILKFLSCYKGKKE